MPRLLKFGILLHTLESSNQQLQPFASEGDKDCAEAIEENVAVIGRMKDRVTLLRVEVENRGLRWSEAEVEDGQLQENGTLHEGIQSSSSRTSHTEAPNGPKHWRCYIR